MPIRCAKKLNSFELCWIFWNRLSTRSVLAFRFNEEAAVGLEKLEFGMPGVADRPAPNEDSFLFELEEVGLVANPNKFESGVTGILSTLADMPVAAAIVPGFGLSDLEYKFNPSLDSRGEGELVGELRDWKSRAPG